MSVIEDITDETIQRVLITISSVDLSSLPSALSSRYDFLGFNPKDFIKALLTKQKVKTISNSDFQSDIVKMIYMFVKIGNPNPETNLKRRSPEALTDYTSLRDKYNIVIKAKAQAANVITIPRVASAFPILTMRIGEKLGVRDFVGPYNSAKLPWFCKMQVFPSIIPLTLPDSTRNFLLAANAAYTAEQSIALDKDSTKTAEQFVVEQFRFVMTIYNSPFPDNSQRTAYFKSLNVPVNYDKIMGVVNKMFGFLTLETRIPTKRLLLQETSQFTVVEEEDDDDEFDWDNNPDGSDSEIEHAPKDKGKGKERSDETKTDQGATSGSAGTIPVGVLGSTLRFSTGATAVGHFKKSGWPPIILYPDNFIGNKNKMKNFRKVARDAGFTGGFEQVDT